MRDASSTRRSSSSTACRQIRSAPRARAASFCTPTAPRYRRRKASKRRAARETKDAAAKDATDVAAATARADRAKDSLRKEQGEPINQRSISRATSREARQAKDSIRISRTQRIFEHVRSIKKRGVCVRFGRRRRFFSEEIMKSSFLDDTAVSTPHARRDTVIRVSATSDRSCDRFIKAKNRLRKPNRAVRVLHGRRRKRETLDECIVTVFPRATFVHGGGSVEISCHGGKLCREILARDYVWRRCSRDGGEFTRRAFSAVKCR